MSSFLVAPLRAFTTLRFDSLPKLLLVAVLVQNVTADEFCSHCGKEPEYIEKTIRVPKWTTKMKTVKCTEYRKVEKERTITCYKCVDVPKTIECEYTVYVPVKKQEEQEVEVLTPTFRWVDQECTCMVPAKEKQTRYRCKKVCTPVTETRTICKDEGCWVKRQMVCDCSGRKSVRCKSVWQPKIVKKEIEVTVNKWETIKEPYDCWVRCMVPVKKTRRVKEWDTKKTTETRTIHTSSYEPRTRTKKREVLIEEKVPYEKTETYTVCEPFEVEKQIPVRVCEMVEKTIRVPVCGCGK